MILRKLVLCLALAASAMAIAAPVTGAAQPLASAAEQLPATAAAKPTITLNGSTSVYPLVVKLAKAYLRAKPGAAQFRILQGGSDVGISDVARGRVTFGMSSRDPQPADPKVTFNRVARDGVCIVTHPSNGLANISRATTQAIFSGRIRNWKDVPGAKVTGPIDLVTRTPASGTQDAFQNIFLGQSLRVAGNASQKATNGLVQQAIRSNRSAIGYLDFKFTAGTAAAPYEGVACNLRNAKSGQYGGVRNFWLVSRGAPTGAGAAFLRWTRSAAGQKIVADGWVSLR